MAKYFYTDLILVLIYASTAKWSWYKIERALDLRGIGGTISSGQILKALIQRGLIEEVNQAQINQEYFLATPKGEEKALQLIDKYGAEFFLSKKQNRDDYEL